MVLSVWLMGMITVGWTYEKMTMIDLPTFAWAIGQNKIEIMALGEYYEIPDEKRDVVFKSWSECRTAISDRFERILIYYNELRTKFNLK